jgi:sensor histidine kinase regulating citrate/malate metabolism
MDTHKNGLWKIIVTALLSLMIGGFGTLIAMGEWKNQIGQNAQQIKALTENVDKLYESVNNLRVTVAEKHGEKTE